MRKKVLNILIILMFVFLAIFSFSVGRKLKNSIPECTCHASEKSVLQHEENCKMKQYLEKISVQLSINELSDNWNELENDQKNAIEEFISEEDPKKYLALLEETSKKKVTKVSTTTRDGFNIEVEGIIPENSKIDAYKTNDKKVNIIENEILAIIKNNEIRKIDRVFTYDISIKNNEANIALENKAVITLNDIKVNKDKKYTVVHLLDEEYAISEGINNNSVQKVTSEKFNDYFTNELDATNKVNKEENSVYVESFDAIINDDDSLSFATDSFSTFYVIEYTVDFHYNGITFNMEGGTSMLLSELFEKLNIDKEVKNVTNVIFSDEELVEVVKQEDGDWLLKSKKAFSTEETLIITFNDGAEISLKVTDLVEDGEPTEDTTFEGSFNETKWRLFENFGAANNINVYFIRWGGLAVLDLNIYDTRGTLLATANTGKRVTASVQVRFDSGNNADTASYWFDLYSEKLNYSYAESQHCITLPLLVGDRPLDITLRPMITYSNSNYCTVRIAESYASTGATNRQVTVYENGNPVGSGTYAFPSRASHNAEAITVTGYDSSKYDVSKATSGENYEVYLKSKVTLNFNANGGTGTLPGNQVVIYGNNFTIGSTNLSRNGYKFLGWAESDTATTAKYKADTSYTSAYTNSGGTQQLYAVWEALSQAYSVKHYVQNETNSVYSESNRSYTLNKTDTITSKTGASLTYSPLSLSSSEFESHVAECYVDESKVDCSSKLQYGKTTEVRLYYKRKLYTVTYNYSNTIVGMPSIPAEKTYFSKADITVASVTPLTGYTLQWYKDGNIIASGSTITDITSNITITGTWIPKTDAYYNIYYYLEGTTTAIKAADTITGVQYGTQVNATAPTIAGYTYSSSSTQPITVGYGSSNITLYYKANTNTPYTVIYAEYKDNKIANTLETDNTRTGTTGGVPSYQEKEYEGFTHIGFELRVADPNGNITDETTNIILGTGKTIVLVKYERNTYNVSWTITKEDEADYKKEGTFTLEYGADLNSELDKVIPEITNYEFSGWDKEYDKMPASDVVVSGVMKRDLNDLIIKKSSTGISVFQVKDLTTGEVIEILVDGTNETVVANLPVGNKYEITELNASIWSEVSPKQEITIGPNENIVNVTTNSLNFGWFRNEIFRRNIFGIIT